MTTTAINIYKYLNSFSYYTSIYIYMYIYIYIYIYICIYTGCLTITIQSLLYHILKKDKVE